MTILNIRKIEDQINKIFNHILKENKILKTILQTQNQRNLYQILRLTEVLGQF
ncbi:unnamed protein product [Paramecium primaurelia]|uniref:Uncharacterized protein n=1 Tax=Paramecium primaurelia TaxID=5886 RepID=A0A8S1QRP4_PARPR|nr:unnamed protein product [Paramecium primaurelia]